MTAANAGYGEPTRPNRVLVVAPFRRDAAVLRELLQDYKIVASICAEPGDLVRELAGDGAPLLMSQEALTPGMLEEVTRYMTNQPNWSELPLVLLLDSGRQNPAVHGRTAEAATYLQADGLAATGEDA